MGKIDVLVYNAGSGVWGNIEELSAHDFEQSWRINTMGAFLVSKEVIPSMKEKKAGTIIFVGATASLRGKPFTTAFAPAKASQRSLAQAIARHLWPSGIHVSLIIIDGGVKSLASDVDVEAPETLNPDDIATTAYFLSQQPRFDNLGMNAYKRHDSLSNRMVESQGRSSQISCEAMVSLTDN
jgi:NAD(P)-dependent dehydrogenase (short-subunit alcohol dehydrogenase family)